jgi:hypothetical protein
MQAKNTEVKISFFYLQQATAAIESDSSRIPTEVQGAAALSVESLGRCCEPGNENIVGNFALVCCPGVGLNIHTKTDLHWLKCGGRSSLGEP